MAPKSQDDHQDESVSRRATPVNPDDPGESPNPSRPETGGDQTDFGAFVSRSVRSSADRFKGGRQGPDARRPSEPQGPTPLPRDSSPRRERPSRYWRDSLREKTGEELTVANPSSRRFLGRPDDEGERSTPSGNGGDNGGDGAWWLRLTGDGEGPNRPLLGFIIVGVLLMLLLIFLLTRLFGGDDQPQVDELDESPVPTQMIGPGVDIEGTPQEGPSPTEAPAEEPTETPEIRRGGDNQLGGDDEEDGTPRAGGRGG